MDNCFTRNSNRQIESKKSFGDNCSLLSNTDLSKPIPKVLIIDKIGILSSLYNFSDIAFIGGGFSGKLHIRGWG